QFTFSSSVSVLIFLLNRFFFKRSSTSSNRSFTRLFFFGMLPYAKIISSESFILLTMISSFTLSVMYLYFFFPFNFSENKFVLRSEEHTSELHSRFDLVCRLLLEKKNI